jgi:23S rRNA (cytosine1962-C5)-methyltransferase
MPTVRIRPGHVRPLWAGHPWVFAQAIANVEGSPQPGDEVDVVDAQGKWMGRGFYSPRSALAVRILSHTEGQALDAQFFTERFKAALSLRRDLLALPNERTTGYRLVHAEGDGLAGLIVDVFDDVATVQLLTAGMKRREQEVLSALASVTGVRSIVEMPSTEHQEREGFTASLRVAHGVEVTSLAFRENGFSHALPLGAAQKTGYYFDQRENRAQLEALCKGRRVLDAFCYMGGFALCAARGGATEVVALDRSEGALAAGQVAAERAGMASRIRFARADVKKELPDMIVRGERFGVVVLDPPKLAHSVKHLERARKAYRHWNAQALRLVEPGGVLVSCSCSAAMQPGDFVRTLALSSADAGRETSLLRLGEQAPDHPTPPAFDEGRYLKAAFLRVL